MQRSCRLSRRPGFTLVEMLVSMVVLVILLLLLTQLTSTLRGVISRTTSGVEQFRDARDAFETMTRRIAQATLNSYDDLNPTLAGNATTTGASYLRASELRFVSGDAGTLLTSTSYSNGTITGGQEYPNVPYPTDAIFFQAPLGFSRTQDPSLTQLLNTCGYYIQWGNDQYLRPSFLPNSYPYRYRFRLMELVEPSENLRIYSNGSTGTSGPLSQGSTTSASWGYASTDWFTYPINPGGPSSPESPNPVHVLAENIIFLAILPMLAPQNAQMPPGGDTDGTSIDIAKNYLYDTTPGITFSNGTGTMPNPVPYSFNQLPPLVYVMMIAVDDQSFARYAATAGTGAPTDLGLAGILTNPSYTQRTADVKTVTDLLTSKKINYRVFSIAVPLSAH